MFSTKRVYIISHWNGSPSTNWYSWLTQQLRESEPEDGFSYQVEQLAVPNWEKWSPDEKADFMRGILPPELLSPDTILVGHGVGSPAIWLHLANMAAQQPELCVGGVLCTAGWFSSNSAWMEISSWMHDSIDYALARSAVPADKLQVMLCDTDSFSLGFQSEKRWLRHLGATISVLACRTHLQSVLDSDVRDAIRDLAGGLHQPLPLSRHGRVQAA